MFKQFLNEQKHQTIRLKASGFSQKPSQSAISNSLNLSNTGMQLQDELLEELD